MRLKAQPETLQALCSLTPVLNSQLYCSVPLLYDLHAAASEGVLQRDKVSRIAFSLYSVYGRHHYS